jgi:hypothetical protein
MDQKYLDKKYLDEIVGINMLWDALGDLIFIQTNLESIGRSSSIRYSDAKKKFGEALILLKIIK